MRQLALIVYIPFRHTEDSILQIDTLSLQRYTSKMFRSKITEYLDANNIPYRILPHTEAVFTVEEAAAQQGVIKEEMIKSILLREKKQPRYVMACVTGDTRLDPQAIREHLPGEWRRLSFASAEEIQASTGYTQGAVAPLCLPDDIPVIFDKAIIECKKVNISNGNHMAGLELDAQDLIHLSGAIIAPIAAPKV
ncbi:MAG: YbaK/EbsC family protein [Gallionellaceae bacterium]